MAGRALPSFADFVTATGENVIAKPKDIISDAVKHTYSIVDMVKGKGESDVVKAGSKLTDRIQLVAGTQFGGYDPNEQFSPSVEDTLTKIEVPWRFVKDCWAWTDHEIKLNEGDPYVQYKSLRDSKRMACTVSMYNGIEDFLWATPNNSTMESSSSTGGRPYSIPCFVTEGGGAPSGFTTVMTVNPTSNPKWKNQNSTYSAASLDTQLAPAMGLMWRKLRFEAPETKGSYFRETKFNKFKIYTNLDGWSNYTRITANSNDRAMIGSRPDLGFTVEDVTFNGIPVKYIEALDDQSYPTGQPRFFFLNFEFLYPIFHSERYMYETAPISGGHSQPFSWVVYKDTWYNLFCRSRYRQGIVYPV